MGRTRCGQTCNFACDFGGDFATIDPFNMTVGDLIFRS
jgi:hypothetical protein